DALAALAHQAVEVSVARRDVAEQRGNADHRPLEVVVEEADGPEHGAVRSAAGAAGGEQALTLSGGWHRDASAASEDSPVRYGLRDWNSRMYQAMQTVECSGQTGERNGKTLL